MLLTYRVENYKGIATQQELNFIATSKNEYQENLLEITENFRVNSDSCIIGPNGSGKSHLLQSLEVLATFIGGAKHKKEFKPFLLDPQWRTKPTKFEILMFSEELNELLDYSISIYKDKVISEKLVAKGIKKSAKNKLIFERDEKGITLGPDYKSSQEMINATVDSGISLISFSKGVKIDQMKEVLDMLTSIFLFTPNTIAHAGPEFIEYLFFEFINIDDIESEKDKLEHLEFRENLLKVSTNILKSFRIPIDSIQIKSNDLDEQYLIINIANNHNIEMSLSFNEASEYFSEGTFNIIILTILISFMGSRKCVFLFDEIDGSLHHKLSLALIDFTRKVQKVTNSQFILSTHDVMLLDHDFRRDSLFVTSKNNNLETMVTRVSDFSIRKDVKISAKYFANEFGSLPKIINDELKQSIEELVGNDNK